MHDRAYDSERDNPIVKADRQIGHRKFIDTMRVNRGLRR